MRIRADILEKKHKKFALESNTLDKSKIYAGGNITNAICNFTADGSFILCPRGPYITIISAATGRRVSDLSTKHTTSVKMIVKFTIPTEEKAEVFASLDVANFVCVWKLLLETIVAVDGTEKYKFRTKVINFFNLHDLSCNSCSFSGINRNNIRAIHTSTGVLGTAESTSLILIVSSSLSGLSKPVSESDDAVYKEEKEKRATTTSAFSSCQICEVFELSFNEILFSESFNPVRLFLCGVEVEKINISNTYSLIHSAIDPSGEFVGICINKMLYVWHRTTDKVLCAYQKIQSTCIAVHPSRQCLATGDSHGQVTIWFILNNTIFFSPIVKETTTQNIKPVSGLRSRGEALIMSSSSMLDEAIAFTESRLETTSLKHKITFTIAIQHWHAHSVKALTYHSSNLISAGQEGVLVIWGINDRRFIPRLNSPILKLSSSPNTVVASLADNSLVIVDPLVLKVRAEFQSVQIPLSLVPVYNNRPDYIVKTTRNDKVPISIIPFISQTSNQHVLLVGSGKTSRGIGPNNIIQIYDLIKDKSLGKIHVSNQNYVPRDRVNLYQWTVQQVAYAENQLVTVEYRKSLLPNRSEQISVKKNKLSSMFTQQENNIINGNLLSKSLKATTKPVDSSVSTAAEECESNSVISDSKRVKNQFSNDINFFSTFVNREWESGKYYLMKFWDLEFDSSDELKKTNLVTVIDTPHVHDVTSITPICRKNLPCDFITTSLDGTWKVWRKHTETKPPTHLCIFTDTYRSLPCLSSSLLEDYSLFAIHHPGCLSVWYREKLRLLTTLPAGKNEHKESGVSWLEVSEQNGVISGDRLLISCSSSSLRVWDFSTNKPKLAWCSTDTKQLLQKNISSLPRIYLLNTPTQCLTIRSVIRQQTSNKVECPIFRIINFDPYKTHIPMLGFSVLGMFDSPYAAFFSGSINITLTSLEKDVQLDELDNCKHASLEETPEDEELVIDTDNEDKNIKIIVEENCLKNEKNDLTKTNFLSHFISKNRPLLIKPLKNSKQIESVIGQSFDGSSHLLPLPSVIYENLMLLSNNRYP